ncbi:hypothetical protein SNE40_018984 [Patella caerulea]|uniref:Nucleolar protein 9 n=1 Tax=Patella caerulea TaxID=87958 RepID=A0AAN8J718_PATCE
MTVQKDTLTYYDRVIVTLQAGFPSDEEKEIFLNNVLEQFSQEAENVCKNFAICICLEELLRHCSNKHLSLFMSYLTDSWSSLVQHSVASHLIQQLLIRLPDILSQEDSVTTCSDSEDQSDNEMTVNTKISKHFQSLQKFFIKNMKTCFDNTHSCQVLRTLLELMGGMEKFHCVERRLQHKKGKGKFKREAPVKAVSIEVPLAVRNKLRRTYKDVTCSITKKIYKQFKDMSYISNDINLLIQTALKIEHELDPVLCNKHCRKIAIVLGLNEEIEEGVLPSMVENSDQQFLYETIIQCSSEDLSAEIYTKLFKGRLVKYALHKRANYSLKAMMNNIKEDQFLDLYDEIELDLENIIFSNPDFNIADLLAGGCLHFRCNQSRFIKQLMNVMHCSIPEERKMMLVPLIVTWKQYEEFFDIKKEEDASERICIDTVPLESVSRTGSFLLQKLLKFGSNKFIIDSMMSLETDDLCFLATNKLGGFIIQAFCESSNIPQKAHDAFCDKFKGSLVKIACDQWGSRAIEDMYKCSSSMQKTAMAEELSYFHRKLQNDLYGHFVCRKLALYHFLHRRDDWNAIQKSAVQKRKLFKDILGDEDLKKKKRK